MSSLLPQPVPESPTVLFVDDESEVARVFVRITKDWGYEADAVCSSEDALKLAGLLNYEVVVTDLLMPELNGVQLIELLSRRLPHTTFVVVSGASARGRVPVELGDRVVSVISKPVNWDDLKAALERAVELSEARKVSSSRPERPQKTLLVEEASTDSLMLRHALEIVDGTKPIVASGLDDALSRLHDTTFETIVVDLDSAGGPDSVARLRAAAPSATLVASSGRNDDSLALRAIDRGAHDFVAKGAVSSNSLRRTMRLARARRVAERREVGSAFRDDLTGVGNRVAWEERYRQAIASSRRTGRRAGVITIDLEGFRSINDLHGYDVGDALLREVGKRLGREVRDYELVSRLCGDEFVVLAVDVDRHGLERLAGRILASLRTSLSIAGTQIELWPRLALSFVDATRSDPNELLRTLARSRHRAGRERGAGFEWVELPEAAYEQVS